eukprot:COSAG02_NODE_3356_length_6878_cov_14.421596_9_plen_126_part_00
MSVTVRGLVTPAASWGLPPRQGLAPRISDSCERSSNYNHDLVVCYVIIMSYLLCAAGFSSRHRVRTLQPAGVRRAPGPRPSTPSLSRSPGIFLIVQSKTSGIDRCIHTGKGRIICICHGDFGLAL